MTNRARSQGHLNLFGLPLVGGLFRNRLAPSDARRQGNSVGRLSRVGQILLLDARESTDAIDPGEVVLTANFPRDGAVSYRVGRLSFTPAAPPAGTRRPAGTAWMVGKVLVLAGLGREPAVENLEGLIERLVR